LGESLEIMNKSHIRIKPIQLFLSGSKIWSTYPQQCFNFFRPINVYARALVCVYIVSRFVVFRFSPAFSSFDVTASGTWCINITMFQRARWRETLRASNHLVPFDV
jgi:hypothetical protein